MDAYLNHAARARVKILRLATHASGADLLAPRAICYHAGLTPQPSAKEVGLRGVNPTCFEGMTVPGILDRLAQNARVHLYEFLQRHIFTAPAGAPWQDTGDWPDEPLHDDHAEPHEPSGPLPYSTELARAYRVLDLPFGAPLADADRRWRAYLKRCHPDRFHAEPSRQTDATELTQQLNAAHDLVEAAWKNASRSG